MHLSRKIVNMRLTKIFIAIFAPDERLPSSATLQRGEALLTSLEECHLHPELDTLHFAPPEQSGTKEVLNL